MKSTILVILIFLSMAAAQQIPQQLTQQLQLPTTQQENSNFVPDIVLFAVSPFYVPAGYNVNASFKAVNTGRSSVDNVIIDLGSLNTSVLVDGPTQRSLGSLKPEEERGIEYTLYSSYGTVPGTYYVPVKVSYLRHNRPFSYNTGIGVSVFSPQPMFALDVIDRPLEVGIGGNITIKITNAGDYPAYNTYATIRRAQSSQQSGSAGTNVTQLLGGSTATETADVPESTMVLGSASVFLGDLDPGERKSVDYTVVPGADLAPGTYAYELQISFRPESANQSVTISYPFGMLFVGRPSIYLSSIEISRSADTVAISGDANNVGSEKVKSVILEATEDDLFAPAYAGSTYYVGTMEPDDFIPFELNAMNKKPNTEPRQYNISIRYLDSRNNEQVEIFSVTIPPQPPEVENGGATSTLRIILVLLVIVVVAVVLFIAVRRRKRNE